MVSNPSQESDVTNYLIALAAIGRNQEIVPLSNLEPKFDLIRAYSELQREPQDPNDPYGFRRIINEGWEELENSDFLWSSFWKEVLTQPLKDNSKEITKFINFYFYVTFDLTVQGLTENWRERGVEDDWRFYDLLCNYKHLTKSNKIMIDEQGADESFRRPCTWECACSKKTKASGYCDQTS